MANSYFEDELKKALARLGVTDKRGDLTAPIASKFQQRVAFDNYRVPSTFTPQEQQYLDSLKVRSYVDEERKRRQMLERVSSISDYASADNRLQELVWQGQVEKDRANQLFEITKSHFEEISRKPEYTRAYNEYINQAANDRSRVTKEKLVDVTKEIQEERPYKKWLWEQAINEMAASDEVQSAVDSIALRRELIGKLPDTDVKPHEIPEQEEIVSREPLKRPRFGAGIIAPDVLDQAAVAARPQGIIDQKVDKKGNTVGNYFIGSLLSTVRSLFTAGTFTPEEQEEIKAGRGKEENLTAAEKFMVSVMTRSAKNMAKRGGGRWLIPIADAVDVGGMSERTIDYLLSSGYKLEQLERPFYERADIENKPWYTKVVAKGVAAIPSLALISATGPAGIGMLTVSSMKTNTENISRRINTGEDISDAASIAYVLGNAALDTASYVLFSKLGQPYDPTAPRSIAKLLNQITGKAGAQALTAALKPTSAMGLITSEMARIIAKAGVINLSNYALSGFLSKLTVDKEKALFGLNKDELITLVGALGAFGSGAIKGAFIGITKFANDRAIVKQYAKLTNRPVEDISYIELKTFFDNFYEYAKKHTADYAEATAGGLNEIVRTETIKDVGAKYTPQDTAPEFKMPDSITVAETGAATKQAVKAAEPPIAAEPEPVPVKLVSIDAKRSKELQEKAVSAFRTTTDPNKARYVMPDGTMVDTSSKPEAPQVEIAKIYDPEFSGDEQQAFGLERSFVNETGAVVLYDGFAGINIGQPLTTSQKNIVSNALAGKESAQIRIWDSSDPDVFELVELKRPTARDVISEIDAHTKVEEPAAVPETTPAEPARRKLVGAKPDTGTGVTVVEGTGDISPPAPAPKPEPKVEVAKPKETYVLNKTEPLAVGKELRSSISGKEYQNTQVTATSLNDVVPSMDANGVAMEGYDKKFQPRDTERASSRMFIDDIARELNPDKFFEKETIQNGIPVIDKNGMVIVGNHRVAALLRAKQQYPEKYEAYKQTALANAAELGLDPDDLQGDFIVTRMLPEGADGQEIADKSNIAEQRDMSAAELARRDASYIDGELLDAFVATDSGTILSRENERFRNLFLEKVLGGRIDGFMDKDGNYSIEGINRMNNALFYKAYGDNAVSALAAESQDHNFKRIITAMRNVAPRIVTLDREIEGGKAFDVDIKTLILESAQRYMTMKNNKEDIFFFATNQELGDTDEIIRAKMMMYLIQQNSGSQQRLTDMYNSLIDAVGLAGDPKQLDMFGRNTPTVDEIIEAAIRTSGDTRMLERAGGERDDETKELSKAEVQGRGREVVDEGDARKSPAKTKANKQTKDSEDRKVAKTDSKLQQSKNIPVVDEGKPGFKVPDEGYNKHLLSLSKDLLSTARYKRLEDYLSGRFRRTSEGKTEVHVESITGTRTLGHEVGHALDYNLEGRDYDNFDNMSLQDRFADSGKTEDELRADAIKVSKAVRPTSEWDDYRDSPTELMADVYGLYLMDSKTLHNTAPDLYRLVSDKIRKSPLGEKVADVVGKVTYEEEKPFITALRPMDKAPDMTAFAKKTEDKALLIVARNARQRSSYVKGKMFITKEWRKEYTEQERQDAGALVEGIANIKTGEMPEETARLKKLVEKYSYEIELIREELNTIVQNISEKDYIEFLEDYLPHFYERNDKMVAYVNSFRKNVRAAKKRTIPTLQDAIEKGLTPISQDVATLLDKYVEINAIAAFNIQFIDDLFKLTSEDGVGIISDVNPDGTWIRVDHPAINRYYARLAGDDKKTVLIHQSAAYIHPEAWPGLRPFFGQIIRTKPFIKLSKVNNISKYISHLISFFHYGNVTESALQALGPSRFLVTRHEGKFMWTYKAGQLLMNEPKVVKDALLAGMQFEPHEVEPYGYAVEFINNIVKKTSKVPVVGSFVKGAAKKHEKFQNNLWNGYVGPLKVYSYHYLVTTSLDKIDRYLTKNNLPDLTPEQLYQLKVDIADFVNNAIGGLEKESYKWTPAVWQIAGMFMRSTEYTMANINNMFKIPLEQVSRITAGITGEAVEPEMYPLQNKMKTGRWAGAMFYLAAGIAILGNALNALSTGKPMWRNPPGRKTYIDITFIDDAIRKIFPDYAPEKERRYIRMGKQLVEVVRLVENPMEVLGSKMSPLARWTAETLTGSSPGRGWDQDFKGKPFWKTILPLGEFDEVGFWKSLIPSRVKHAADAFVPLSLKGNNWFFTFPMVRGVSKTTMRRAYMDTIKAQVDPTLFGKLMPKGTAEKRMKELEEGAKINGYDHDQYLAEARTALRTSYYPKFWEAINTDNQQEAERIAAILLYIETSIAGIKQSGRYREVPENLIRKAVNIVEKQKANKRR